MGLGKLSWQERDHITGEQASISTRKAEQALPSAPRPKIELRSWYGPAMMVAIKGNSWAADQMWLGACEKGFSYGASCLGRSHPSPSEEEIPVPRDGDSLEGDEAPPDLFAEEEAPVPMSSHPDLPPTTCAIVDHFLPPTTLPRHTRRNFG